MISAKVIHKQGKEVDAIIKRMRELDEGYVEVGILGEGKKYGDSGMTVLGVATIHEFGYEGITKDGKFLSIPERSFIRASFETYSKGYAEKWSSYIAKAVRGDISTKTLFKMIGEDAVAHIQEHIDNMKSPPLKASTIEAKGSDKLLVDTGQLRGSIAYEIKGL